MGERHDRGWVEAKLVRLTATLAEVLARSKAERRPTHVIADEIARARIAEALAARAAA